MEIHFNCPKCGKAFQRAGELAGKRAICKQCSTVFVIPSPSRAADLRSSGRPSGAGASGPVAEAVSPAPPRNPAPARDRSMPAPPARRATGGNPPWLLAALALGGLATALLIGVLAFLAIGRKTGGAAVGVEAKATAGPGPAKPAAPADLETGETPGRPLSTAELVSRSERSVALIKGKRGLGTGFLVRPGILATNAHVIDGEKIPNLEVRFPSADGDRRGPFSARLLHRDRVRDLAFLAVDTDLPPLRLATAYTYRKGEDVTVIGNPGIGGDLVLENAISRGVVSSKIKLNGKEFLQLGVSINPGNSGGPVLDSEGRVIGVATLKTTRQEGLAFCVPAVDLIAALDVATSRADGVAAGPKPASGPGAIPELKYAWKPGQTYVYSVEVTLEGVQGAVALRGSSLYRVKSVDDDGLTLGHRGWLVTRRRGKDGRVVPGGVSGPSGGHEVELKIDPKGNILNAAGSSPLPLLGDLAMLVIEPLPDGPEASWEDSHAISLNEVQQVGGGPVRLGRPGLDLLPRGARSRLNSRLGGGLRGRLGARVSQPAPPPQVKVTSHPAQEQTNYALGAASGDSIPIAKTYELATQEVVGTEPRLKMTGEGTITFDVKAGMPLAVDFRARVVENAENVTVRVPVLVSCRLLEGDERAIAMRAPVMPPTALNPIDEDDLDRILAAFKSGDANGSRGGCQTLYDAAPVEERRGEVARALERLLGERDPGLRSQAIRALGVWGDARSAEPLVGCLDDESAGARDELFESLGRVPHNARTADAVAPWLSRDANRAGRTLRAIGAVAEPALLKVVAEGDDVRARGEACRVLKDVGGPQSVPVLEEIARRKAGGELGRVAAESLKAIARRHPEEPEWASILQDAGSPDGGRRRQAADRLLAIDPIEPRRAEVARALEALAGDVDGGTQSLAIRALGAWGDGASRSFLIARLRDPSLRPVREAVDALRRLGADGPGAEAVATWWTKDRGLARDALTAMGPVAEKATLALLKKETDGGSRSDLCQLLGRIGTKASLPALEAVSRTEKNGFAAGAARNAIQEIGLKAEGDAGMAAVVADLKSSDHNRCKQAVERLARVRPGRPRRAEVARALDALLDDRDIFMRRPLMEAVGRWGDAESADLLAARLDRTDLRDWRETLLALVALRPDDRTADLAVRRLPEDGGLVTPMLRSLGPGAERALLMAAKSGQGGRLPVEACRSLGVIGTPAAIPDLQALARKSGDEPLARDAEDALKNIRSRL